MMFFVMSKLDDLFGKKKEVVPILDLSKSIVNSKEEMKRLMEKVPDFKMRPIKTRPEDIKLKEKDFSFKMTKKEYKHLIKNNGVREIFYIYVDPIPIEMRSIVIMELCHVPIDWKMLTTMRPKTKIEEDYFSKLVEIGKYQLKTETKDKREITLNPGIRKVKNKSGVVETRIVTCADCSEEFCNGRGCNDFNYDLYTRIAQKIVKPKSDPAALMKLSDTKKGKVEKIPKNVPPIMKKAFKKRSRSKSPLKKKEKAK